MRSLESHIKESFKIKLSDFEDSEDNVNKSIEKSTWSAIKKWIEDNYNIEDISYNYDKEKDIYKVSSKKRVTIKNKKITSLTNGDFEWDIVEGYFDCSHCESLKTLERAPRIVNGNFNCSYCDSLTSLKGAPEKVEGYFDCSHCKSLKILKGAPDEVRGCFYCSYCESLTSLKGAPREIKSNFYCGNCQILTSLKGLKKINGNIYCGNCPNLKDFAGFTNIKK